MITSLPVDDDGLILFSNVRELGRQSELRSSISLGIVERIRRGVYRVVGPAVHSDMDAHGHAERERYAYITEVHAAAHTLTDAIFTSYSAAALLGLPIIGQWPSDVFVLSRDGHGSRRPGVVTVARTREVEVRTVDQCATTSVEFTLIQLARHAPLVAALAAADAALHVPRFGGAAPLTTVERLRGEHERLKPYPRSRRTDAVLRRATTLADTPLETGSRLLIEELGFAQPELQHELWLPELGRRAFLDFYWPDINVGAEADGRGKYRGPASERSASRLRADTRSVATRSRVSQTSEEVVAVAARRAVDTVISEKDRENAVRRQLDGFDRWDWIEMRRKHPVAARLEALGVPRVRRPMFLI